MKIYSMDSFHNKEFYCLSPVEMLQDLIIDINLTPDVVSQDGGNLVYVVFNHDDPVTVSSISHLKVGNFIRVSKEYNLARLVYPNYYR